MPISLDTSADAPVVFSARPFHRDDRSPASAAEAKKGLAVAVGILVLYFLMVMRPWAGPAEPTLESVTVYDCAPSVATCP